LCKPCTQMFEDFGEVDLSEHGTRGFNNCTSFEELVDANLHNCYVCTNVYDQLQDERAIELLKVTEGPLLLREAWKTFSGDIFGSILLAAPASQRKETGVQQWNYLLMPASKQNDQFGFQFVSDKPNQLRAVHQLYKNIPASTKSPEAAVLARGWYQECRDKHARWCGNSLQTGTTDDQQQSQVSIYDDSWYPPRLLDTSATPPILVLRQHVEKGEAFAALSHCWGASKFLTLTDRNMQAFQQHGIEPSDMPENFGDAVQICQSLGIRYVWIDSLCILQSGPGSQSDWESHVGLMQSIYANCNLCISTAATDSATKSCFRERNIATIAPRCVVVNEEPYLLISQDHAIRGHRNAPIASRAWVFQERLLSRRILTFGPTQIFWECLKTALCNVCETFPQGLLSYGHQRGPFSLPTAEKDPGTWPLRLNHEGIWLNLIETYCECHLSQQHEDKFAAFSGIAQHMQAYFGSLAREAHVSTACVTYVAGLFAYQLPAGLLWYVRSGAEPQSRPKPPGGFYRAPSWSWAATDSLMRFTKSWIEHKLETPPHLMVFFTTIQNYQVIPARKNNPYGQLLHAELSVHTVLLPMNWSGPFPASKQEFVDATLEFPNTSYMDKFYSVRFDSRDDFDGSQHDVVFMPIVAFGSGSQVEGLVLRATDPAKSAYVRIGMAVTRNYDNLPHLRASVTQEIVLL